nr:YsnF/AvaK domain-containing protein [Rhizobium cauense]
MVSVQVDDANYESAHDLLDDEGSIDIDERADQWRTEGWQSLSNEAYGSSTYDRNAATERGRVAGSGLSEQRKFDDDLDRVVPQANASREDVFDAGDRTQTIPVVEENLRVGKRDVNHGSVRVRAYTVEEPVSEDVRLHDENVEIERRAVDRPVSDADDAFRDRMISAEEHHEEAVVRKEARVVEEIGIRKTASGRTETINETVRKTEVEVDDERSPQSQSQNGLGQSQTGKNNSFRQD